ncbi:autotransporter outer membrane beta-barrel domain-containing protein [Bartonella machadoae]|uniref:autotransporter outer membrane beta-barrel domain-containing protein n=1 Tax=Bartonella machadoae TaxID=2893471 RepID=UPI001F4CE3FF|nr:autotransporter outer membrane beta-barrel domain-containing protein [Bartonella machadoae]UNE53602.1 autotransporter outer membrane beta-barrel domain-containing protein [Bartonella machadoae]
MINVFKNRTRLCAVTTSVFFFLQGVEASAAWGLDFSSIKNMFSFGTVSFGTGGQSRGSLSQKASGEQTQKSQSLIDQPQALPQTSLQSQAPSQPQTSSGSGTPSGSSTELGSQSGPQLRLSSESGGGGSQGSFPVVPSVRFINACRSLGNNTFAIPDTRRSGLISSNGRQVVGVNGVPSVGDRSNVSDVSGAGGVSGTGGVSGAIPGAVPGAVPGVGGAGVPVAEGVDGNLAGMTELSDIDSYNFYDALYYGDGLIYESIPCLQGGMYALADGTALAGSTIMADDGGAAVYVGGVNEDGEDEDNSSDNGDGSQENGSQDLQASLPVNGDLVTVELVGVSIEDAVGLTSLHDNEMDMQKVFNLAFLDTNGSQNERKYHNVGVFVNGAYKDRATVDLIDSQIQGFFAGLRAENFGEINMIGGGIRGGYIGAISKDDGEIYLRNVDINVSKIGLLSSGPSVIGMHSGKITVSEGGIGVKSIEGGIVHLNRVSVNIAKKKQSTRERQPRDANSVSEAISINVDSDYVDSDFKNGSVGLLTRGGIVSFKNGSLNGSDTVVLWVNDNFENAYLGLLGLDQFRVDVSGSSDGSSRVVDESESNGGDDSGRNRRQVNINERQQIDVTGSVLSQDDFFDSAHDGDHMNDILSAHIEPAHIEVASAIVNVGIKPEISRNIASGNASDPNGVIKNSALMVSDIQNSILKADGSSYGIYFDQFTYFEQDKELDMNQEEGDKNQEERIEKGVESRLHAVLLKNSTLRTPEGVAIYGDNLGGYVVVKDDSTVSGGLLLKTERKANLSVVVDDSVVIGATRVEDESQAKLFLSGGSEWYVTKSAYNGFEVLKPKCMDSCISSVSLSNSNIRFFTSLESKNTGGSEGVKSVNYRTLRIGNGDGTVYSAHGDSKIFFNVNLMPKDANSAQVSDRLLIDGDISGKTKVYVNPVSDAALSESSEQQNTPYSVSLIQVFGNAEKDSFTLHGDYITLNGSPYQYILRAYGPSASSSMRYFDSTLSAKGTSVWDFRLENQYFVSSDSAYTTASNFQVIALESVLSPSSAETGDSLDEESGEVVTPPVPTPSEGFASGGTARGDSLARSEPAEEQFGEYGLYEGYGPSAEYETEGYETTVFVPLVVTLSTIPAASDGSGPRERVLSSTLTRSDTGDVSIIPAPSGAIPSGGESVTLSGLITSEDLTYVVPTSSESIDTLTLFEEPAPIISSASMSIPETADSTESIIPTDSAMTAVSTDSTEVPVPTEISVSTGSASTDSTKTVVSTETPVSTGSVSTDSIATPVSTETSVSTGSASTNSIATPVSTVLSVSTGSVSTNSTEAPVSTETSVSTGSARTDSIDTAKTVASTGNSASIKSGASGKSSESSTVSVARVSNASTRAVASQCSNTENNSIGKTSPYLCNDGTTHTMKNLTLQASDKTQHSMHAQRQNTVIELEGAAISGGHSSKNGSNIDLTKLRAVSAVLAEEGATVVLNKKSTVQSSLIGLEAQRGGKVKMDDGTVNVQYVGALVGSGSAVELSNTNINVTGDLAVAGLASNAGEITMRSGTINLDKGVAVRSESGGSVKLEKVNITARKGRGKQGSAEKFGSAAFLLNGNSSVDFTNGTVTTDASALWVRNTYGTDEVGTSRRKRSSEVRPSINRAKIESSTVKVEGDKSYGIYFDGTERKGVEKQDQNKNLEKPVSGAAVESSGVRGIVKRSAASSQEKTLRGITGEVSLKKTDFEVLKSVAIYGNNSGGRVSLENKTTLSGDLLLKAENNSNILLSVNDSVIAGGARIDKGSHARLDLTNGSKWLLKSSAHKSGVPDSECMDSCVSSVSLVNSRIEFVPSETETLKYQTLRIGEGKGVVYKAQGDVSIHLNAHLNPNDPIDRQATDRLVIHGDVEGKTTVHVQGVSGSVEEGKKTPHSVSLIQVYGKAAKDSFQLNSDYVALRNSPYKYTLRAYAPEATSKQEHVQQKFVKDGGDFWNFRLENQYVKSLSPMVGFGLPEQVVRSVVPQVPTYLLLPNSVFHAGLMDVSNQNKQLELLRATSNGMVEVRENPALYLRGYGGSYRYASDLSALEYGYKGDLTYNGLEAGVLLQTIENADSAISFGVMGSYGKLSLQPVDVEQSQKSAFDKWTATAYGTMQHDVGFYVDGLLSYGLFKGDVLTLARGKTATLKGSPLSASLTGGKTFATGYRGFVVDPQVQVVYQYLQFDKTRDVDNFDIEMGKLDQWVARIGGRLIKTPTGSEGMNAVSFYGKLHLAHGFGGKKSVHFKDAFQLGSFGSSLEAGLGFNAKLSAQFALHGDVMYQHKLNKAGFSGASLSGGVRYQF